MAEKLVIIGSGMATAKLLELLDERGADFHITVIGEEPQSSYNRILLSSILSGDKAEADAVLLDNHWYHSRNVTLRTGERVAAVDTDKGGVVTERGEYIPYDRLVFATGSRAMIPDIDGTDADGVMGFRSLSDLDALRGMATNGGRAVVVGAGLLGLEAAHGLNLLGMEVTVVHRNAWPMNRQLDAEAGELLHQLLEARGIRFAMNVSPATVNTQAGKVTGIALSDGAELAADLVLFAAGIVPRDELARAAGIHCRGAIAVNEFLQTSTENVYALGECCEIDGRTFGLVAPVYEQAACLADLLSGRPTAGYCHRETPTQLKVSGVELFSAGRLPFPEHTTSQVVRSPRQGVYRRLVFDGDRLVGAVLLGDRSGGVWFDELIRSGESVAAVRPWMMFGRQFADAG